MKPGMQQARNSLGYMLESNDATQAMVIRVHGDNLVLSRRECSDEQDDLRDCVRLTRITSTKWALSVKRHTGRWQRTPFVGTMDEVVNAIWAYMQHLVQPW